MNRKTLLDEIAIEAMKALIIAKCKYAISLDDCQDIASDAYDAAKAMLAEKKNVEKEMAEETMKLIDAMD